MKSEKREALVGTNEPITAEETLPVVTWRDVKLPALPALFSATVNNVVYRVYRVVILCVLFSLRLVLL